jgi:hypothetical protein
MQKSFPFPHFILPSSTYEKLEHFALNWLNKWQLANKSQKDFACVYIKHCSPEYAVSMDLSMIAIYMLWVSVINDTPNGPKRLALLEEVHSILRGEIKYSNIGITTIGHATIEFIDELHKHYTYHQTQRVMDQLCQLITATYDETLLDGRFPSLIEYLKLREQTIATYPYLELFRLGLKVPSHLALYERLEQICVQCVFLVNDVFSVQRDMRKGKLNLVFCLARDREISIDAALEEALIMTYNRMHDFTTLSRSLVESGLDDASYQYVTFLGSIQEGNRVGIMELHERYFGNS